MTQPRLWPAVTGAWLLACAVLVLGNLGLIASRGFHDPDDAMRLLEVQDWIAGQSWWDVSQHRLGAGTVFQMHWSRIVDLPIAALVAPLAPVLGQGLAERIAMTAVPLAQLLLAILLLTDLTRRLAGTEAARIAAFIVPMTAPLLAQLQPMRIDHHGWQILCAIAALSAVLARPSVRSGAVAGSALAFLVSISLEGLPYAAGLVGIATLAALYDPARRAQARALAAALLLATAALHVATRGPNLWAPACDAIAPAWLAALGVGAAGVALALLPGMRLAWRLALLGAAGTAALGLQALVAPACLRGPFGMLDPLTRSIWFDNISEGLPIWRQALPTIGIAFSLPLIGILGSTRALRVAPPEERQRWAILLAVQIAALACALIVLRASGAANAVALPGAAVIVARLLGKARRMPRAAPRIAATAGALALAAPGAMAGVISAPFEALAIARPVPGACRTGSEVAALDQLPPSRLFAPLDMGPELLATTRHEAIASGYHRNVAMMHLVIASFLGSPEEARRAVLRTHAAYVVGCPGLPETEIYKAHAPNGFWARLERGERFAWLQPVPITGSPVRAWRVQPFQATLSDRGAAH